MSQIEWPRNSNFSFDVLTFLLYIFQKLKMSSLFRGSNGNKILLYSAIYDVKATVNLLIIDLAISIIIVSVNVIFEILYPGLCLSILCVLV